MPYRGQTRDRSVSNTDALVQHLRAHFHVKFVMVCQTNNHVLCPKETHYCNNCVALLNHYLRVVLNMIPYAEFGPHKGLCEANVPILCKDRLHQKRQGQYALYRSYHGTMYLVSSIS